MNQSLEMATNQKEYFGEDRSFQCTWLHREAILSRWRPETARPHSTMACCGSPLNRGFVGISSSPPLFSAFECCHDNT